MGQTYDFGISPESNIYYHIDNNTSKNQIKNLVRDSLSIYGDGEMVNLSIYKKENKTPLRLINWINEYGEMGGLRCTDKTPIYIIRDDHLMFCEAKNILVGDNIPLRYNFEISLNSKVVSNSVVPYVDEYIFCFDNKRSVQSTIIVNDTVIKLEGIYEYDSRMAAD